MKYDQIKKKIETAATKQGYIKEDNQLVYRNHQLIIAIELSKSPFEEQLERLQLLITPSQFLGRYQASEPLTAENAIIKVPVFELYTNENSNDNDAYFYDQKQLLSEIDELLAKVKDQAYIKRLITSNQIKVNTEVLKEWDIDIAANLDYNTIYFGTGLEIKKIIEKYFGSHLEQVNLRPLIPNNLEVTNIVGLDLKYVLYDRFIVNFYITNSFEFTILNQGDQQQYYHYNRYSDFMTTNKLNTYMYDLSEPAISEQIRILDIAVANIIQGKQIRVVDIEQSYTQLKTKYNLINAIYGLIKMLLFIAVMVGVIIVMNTIVESNSSDPVLDQYVEVGLRHELETFALPAEFNRSSKSEPFKIDFTQDTTTQYDMSPYYMYVYEYTEKQIEPGIYTIEFNLATDNQYKFEISNKYSQLKFDVMNQASESSVNKIVNVPIYEETKLELFGDQPILGSEITLTPQTEYINYQQVTGVAGYYRVESLTDSRYLTITNRGLDSVVISYATTEGQEYYQLYSQEEMKFPVKDDGTIITNSKAVDFE